jgi:acyl carrier protein
MAMVELLIAVEEAFDAEFTDDLLRAATFETPGALWNAVSQLRSRVAAA